MIFDHLYYSFSTSNSNLLAVLLQVNRYSGSSHREEENPIVQFFYIFMSIILMLALVFTILSIFRDFILHFLFKIPQFSMLFRYTPKNLRFAYKVIGCHIVVSDAGDRRGQYMFLISYLKRRFPKVERLNLSEIPNLHSYYPKTHEVYVWLNRHFKEEEKLQFIDFMVDLAFYNEKLSRRELGLIYEAGKVFGIPKIEVKSILTMRYKFYQDKRRREQEHRRKTRATRRPKKNLKNEALKILGLTQNITDFDVVKKAYRNMAKKHHPDRFHNDSEQEQEKAHERFTEINTAYEYLEQVMK
ncbi:MAG: hypothetical protein COA32_09520 [Fluviicola sp.]|nr:MAG: hypothetical protein COA32_09520 [Fluviicola sp.]